jgi:hypothetical protein
MIAKTIVLGLMFAGLSTGAAAAAQTQGQDDPNAFYENGNKFLSVCDSSSLYMLGKSSSFRQSWGYTCTFWVLGVLQGMGIEDQFRPHAHTLTPEETKAAKESQDYLASLNITPNVTMPDGNVCVPTDVTNEQYKLVVIAFMRNHPDKLTTHSAILAIAAFKNAWACK